MEWTISEVLPRTFGIVLALGLSAMASAQDGQMSWPLVQRSQVLVVSYNGVTVPPDVQEIISSQSPADFMASFCVTVPCSAADTALVIDTPRSRELLGLFAADVDDLLTVISNPSLFSSPPKVLFTHVEQPSALAVHSAATAEQVAEELVETSGAEEVEFAWGDAYE